MLHLFFVSFPFEFIAILHPFSPPVDTYHYSVETDSEKERAREITASSSSSSTATRAHFSKYMFISLKSTREEVSISERMRENRTPRSVKISFHFFSFLSLSSHLNIIFFSPSTFCSRLEEMLNSISHAIHEIANLLLLRLVLESFLCYLFIFFTLHLATPPTSCHS